MLILPTLHSSRSSTWEDAGDHLKYDQIKVFKWETTLLWGRVMSIPKSKYGKGLVNR